LACARFGRIAVNSAGPTLPATDFCPLAIRVPTRCDLTNPKWTTAMTVTDRSLGGFQSDRVDDRSGRG
jgi:DMSO/TMAO reductase YedYZ molybdopterin-dependent catalytic subunit